jgi:hypothetical protein
MDTGSEILEALRHRFPFLSDLPGDVWVVGGAVRDVLNGEEPADLDLAAGDAQSCALEVARRAGGRAVRVGSHEMAALRIATPGGLCDVTPITGQSIHDDLGRRDLTINAMAVSCRSGELLDPFDGRGDLARRCIRMVAAKNFDEDPLRMLKAARIAMRLGFSFDEATLSAIRERSRQIESVAPERVTDELVGLLSYRPLESAFGLLSATGLDRRLFGRPLDPASVREVDVAGYDAVVVGLAVLFAHAVDDVAQYAERWRWSRDLRRDVEMTIRSSARLLANADPALLLYDLGEAESPRLIAFLRAIGEWIAAADLDYLRRTRGEEIFMLQPLLSGDEIATIAGISTGPRVGRLKRHLIEAQLQHKIPDREAAENFIREATVW